jgi:hypothetical protein
MAINDRECMLTAEAGDSFTTGTTYGAKFFDMGAAGVDAARGEPLEAFIQVITVTETVTTSIAIALIADTDGAGGSAAELLDTGVVLTAAATTYLTVARGVQSLGIVRPNMITATLRYLSLRVIASGGVYVIRAWITKATNSQPQNVAANKFLPYLTGL